MTARTGWFVLIPTDTVDYANWQDLELGTFDGFVRRVTAADLFDDEELMERVAGELCNHTDRDGTPAPCDEHKDRVRVVLAALIPEPEET